MGPWSKRQNIEAEDMHWRDKAEREELQRYGHQPLLALWKLVAQLYLTLCDPMDSSSWGFSVHGIPSWQEYWEGSPSLLQTLPNQGLEPVSPACIALLALKKAESLKYGLQEMRNEWLIRQPAMKWWSHSYNCVALMEPDQP